MDSYHQQLKQLHEHKRELQSQIDNLWEKELYLEINSFVESGVLKDSLWKMDPDYWSLECLSKKEEIQTALLKYQLSARTFKEGFSFSSGYDTLSILIMESKNFRTCREFLEKNGAKIEYSIGGLEYLKSELLKEVEIIDQILKVL